VPDLDDVPILIVDEPPGLDLGLDGSGELRQEHAELFVPPELAAPREPGRLVDLGLRVEEPEMAGTSPRPKAS
jgi:hypothetical protein